MAATRQAIFTSSCDLVRGPVPCTRSTKACVSTKAWLVLGTSRRVLQCSFATANTGELGGPAHMSFR
jgi:hypothetical protein